MGSSFFFLFFLVCFLFFFFFLCVFFVVVFVSFNFGPFFWGPFFGFFWIFFGSWCFWGFLQGFLQVFLSCFEVLLGSLYILFVVPLGIFGSLSWALLGCVGGAFGANRWVGFFEGFASSQSSYFVCLWFNRVF